MLASELRLRGIEVPRATIVEEEKPVPRVQPTIELPAAVESSAQVSEEVAAPSLADDWEPMWLAQADDSAEYWESLVPGFEAPHLSQAQAMRLVKGFRMAQGDRKQADRARGIRRYRLNAFGV
jgi:hypothetical protein